jgi:Transposase IS116/IS110/IS902 family
MLADQVEALARRVATLENEIVAEVRRDDTMRRLATIPGVGPITAATIVALVPDPRAFASGRHFAAWIGLTPKRHSTGGKERLGRISKMGNPVLRSLLVVGATAVSRHARRGATVSPWLTGLLRQIRSSSPRTPPRALNYPTRSGKWNSTDNSAQIREAVAGLSAPICGPANRSMPLSFVQIHLSEVRAFAAASSRVMPIPAPHRTQMPTPPPQLRHCRCAPARICAPANCS